MNKYTIIRIWTCLRLLYYILILGFNWYHYRTYLTVAIFFRFCSWMILCQHSAANRYTHTEFFHPKTWTSFSYKHSFHIIQTNASPAHSETLLLIDSHTFTQGNFNSSFWRVALNVYLLVEYFSKYITNQNIIQERNDKDLIKGRTVCFSCVGIQTYWQVYILMLLHDDNLSRI